jgi:uncharacterized membrane protein
MSTIAILIALHALFAAIWVGGLAFAYMVLRPSVDVMPPPERLSLLARIFRRWFVWIWHAVVIIPLTGYLVMFMLYGGFAGADGFIHLMQGMGWIMVIAFLALFFGPYPAFRRAVAAEDWAGAAPRLKSMRRIIAFNLVLGLATVAVGAGGRYWEAFP